MITAAEIIDDLLASGATEITLGMLSREATGRLLAEGLDQEPADAFVAASFEATGGNPLLLGELVRALREQHVAPTSASVGQVRALVPRSLLRRVRSQFRQLPPAAESLARAVAVLGSDATISRAVALSELTLTVAAEAADALRAAGLFEGLDPPQFAHTLVRAAVLSDVAPMRQSAMHARAADLLAAQEAPVDRVANHLLRAAPEGRARWVRTLVRAADDALHHADPSAAITFLERALAEGADDVDHWELLYSLGKAEDLAQRPAALAHLRAAYERCPSTERAKVALLYGALLGRSGQPDEAFAVLSTAIDETDNQAMACLLEATLIAQSQIVAALVPHVQERMPRLRRLPGDTREERALLAIVAYATGIDPSVPAADALEIAERALQGDTLHRLPSGGAMETLPAEWWPFGMLSRTLATLGEVDRAQAVIDWIFAGARAAGSVDGYFSALIVQSSLAYTRGDVAAAADDVATVIEEGPRAGSMGGLLLAAGMRAVTALEIGDLDDALAWLASIGMLGPLPEAGVFDVPLFCRATLRAEAGELEPALADLVEFGRREKAKGYRSMFTPWRASAANVLHRLGRTEEAIVLVEDELSVARARGVAWLVAIALRVKGLVAGGDAGLAALAEAVEVAAPTPFRLEAARCYVEYGAALRRANRRAEARTHLETGVDLATRCASNTLRDRAMAELAATGARPRRTFVTGPESLTAMERRVAEMAAGGKSNPAIAQALFVSRKTVETHLSRVFQKLSIAARGEIAAALKP